MRMRTPKMLVHKHVIGKAFCKAQKTHLPTHGTSRHHVHAYRSTIKTLLRCLTMLFWYHSGSGVFMPKMPARQTFPLRCHYSKTQAHAHVHPKSMTDDH